MKKIILMSLLISLFVSCGSDDDEKGQNNNNNSPITTLPVVGQPNNPNIVNPVYPNNPTIGTNQICGYISVVNGWARTEYRLTSNQGVFILNANNNVASTQLSQLGPTNWNARTRTACVVGAISYGGQFNGLGQIYIDQIYLTN